MGGFSTIAGDPIGSVMNADNCSFDGTARGGVITTNGLFWIGSTALPHLKPGTIVSTDSTLTVSYSSPNITLSVNPAGPIVEHLTGDSGGILNPTANNFNIFGLSGSKTSGSGSTITIKSPPYSDQGGSTTVTLNSGSFATAAITLTTPATAGLADGDLLEFVATNGVLVIQLAATQVAHIGSVATSVAGTLTSTATGDSVSLRYQASTNDFWATSVIGTWVLA